MNTYLGLAVNDAPSSDVNVNSDFGFLHALQPPRARQFVADDRIDAHPGSTLLRYSDVQRRSRRTPHLIKRRSTVLRPVGRALSGHKDHRA